MCHEQQKSREIKHIRILKGDNEGRKLLTVWITVDFIIVAIPKTNSPRKHSGSNPRSEASQGVSNYPHVCSTKLGPELTWVFSNSERHCSQSSVLCKQERCHRIVPWQGLPAASSITPCWQALYSWGSDMSSSRFCFLLSMAMWLRCGHWNKRNSQRSSGKFSLKGRRDDRRKTPLFYPFPSFLLPGMWNAVTGAAAGTLIPRGWKPSVGNGRARRKTQTGPHVIVRSPHQPPQDSLYVRGETFMHLSHCFWSFLLGAVYI